MADMASEEGSTHRLPTVRWWLLGAVALGFAISFAQITQPDYNTNRRAGPDEWLWVVIPALMILSVLARRLYRGRIETTATEVRVIRALTTDEIAWTDVAGFEVRPTTNRVGFIVSLRHRNGRVTRLGTIPGRSGRRRDQADAFAARMESCRPTAVG